MSRFERAAVELATRGYHVFPLKPRGKTPLTSRGFKDATRDERQILAWWDKWPDANIGVACGASGIAVLDADPKHGCDAEDLIGKLNGAVIVRTGEAPESSDEFPASLGGERGAHAYYRGKVRTVPKVDGQPGVEIRGAGGYVVAPPSAHPSGVEYTGVLPPVSVLPAAPDWLRKLGERSSNSGNGMGTGEAPVVERVPPGGMHEYLADLAVRLARTGQRDAAVVEAQLVAAFDVKRAPGARYAGGREDTARLAKWAVESQIARREQGRAGDASNDTPAAALTELLKLDMVGCRVVGARIVGTGSTASADLYVVDGNGERSEITFKARRDVANAQRLNVEMSCFGVVAALKAPDAIQANVLLGRIATIEETASEDDAAADWGLAFLRDADTLDVDLSDQTQRWAAFSRLRDTDPFAAVRNDGVPLAGACVALRAQTGERWVRSSWFYEHVRRLEAGVMSRVEVNQRMQRVGWTRRRGQGRVKATHPTDENRTPILLAFYIVPASWEETR